SMQVLEACLDRRVPIVVATTGFSAEQQQRIRLAAQTIAVLWAPSMSLAVNLAMKLSGIAATALRGHSSGVDVEIIERHHRYKEDAPSGTALKFGEIIRAAMGQLHERHGREGRPGARPHNEIGYHAVRTGDNPGEHTIVFGMLGETLEIAVRASNRDCYAYGALSAAKFIAHRPVGLYSMNDVLGI
ncbi:MAG TPA: 4-hydroxy-tetrahydrodipicolinate reductase, partial [Pirellulales bacterium]|nr:4-hydroxy-tetrahydrodipicolinate reductase [Pirellulales bacterium]